MARCMLCLLTILWLVGFPTGQGFAAFDDNETALKAQGIAHYILANVHELNGEARQAQEQYRQAIKLSPNQISPRLKLAAYDVRFDETEDAIRQLKAVTAIAPDSYEAHYLLALVYSSIKKFDLAAKEYEAVLKHATNKNPLSIEVHAYLAQLYFAQGKMDQAMVQFQDILMINPQHLMANYLLGSIFLEQGKYDEAIEHLRRALSVKPDHDGVLNTLAYAYAQKGVHLDQALTMIRRAIDLDPTNGAYYDSYGWVLYKSHLFEESLSALQKAERFAQDAVVYEHLGDVYLAMNNATMARKNWLRSLQLDSKQPQLRQKLEMLNKDQALKSPQP